MTARPAAAMPAVDMSCAEAIVAGLRAAGVREVFGVAGGKFAVLMRAIDAEPSLRFTGVRNEAAAAFMATAVAHRTGGLAACVAEMGPGALNLASGLDTALANGLPVLAITAGTPTALRGHGQIMDLDAATVFSAVTKWRATVADENQAREWVDRAVAAALGGAPGPVHLEFGYDVLGAAVSGADPRRVPAVPEHSDRPRPDPDAVRDAAALLGGARCPLLIAGGGAVASGAAGELRELAATLDAPVLVTQMGIGLLADDDPLLAGQGGIVFGEQVLRALREADVVLAVGCRFSSWLWEGAAPARGAGQRLAHLDIDPARIGQLRHADVALLGDARAGLADLRERLGSRVGAADPQWRAGLLAERREYLASLRTLGADSGPADGPMHPAALAAALGDALPDDALVVYDGAHTSFWSNDLTPVREPRTRFHDPGAGHLGFGVPYAHALALIETGRPVVDITGDGAFGFSVAELDTAVRLGLSVVHVIHDNQAWGVIGFAQDRLGFSLGTALDGTDYAAIARGFGAWARRIETPAEVRPALRDALAAGRPAVIDARVRFEPHPGLPRFGATGRVQ